MVISIDNCLLCAVPWWLGFGGWAWCILLFSSSNKASKENPHFRSGDLLGIYAGARVGAAGRGCDGCARQGSQRQVLRRERWFHQDAVRRKVEAASGALRRHFCPFR